MPGLFDPLKVRGVTLRNRIGFSPVCQYSSPRGFATDWHLAHLGARAVGGAGLVIAEATAVAPSGRITTMDLGLWRDEQVDSHRRLTTFIAAQGCVPGIQLAHAGRKGSRVSPWEQDASLIEGRHLTHQEGAWPLPGPSERRFAPESPLPFEMTQADIERVIDQFADAAARAAKAGYRWIEVHAAHGYLLHSFMSPISNSREDDFGGSLGNRCRLAVEVARAMRRAMPNDIVLAFRISYTDWEPDGWDLAQSIYLCGLLRGEDVDLIDVSSGGSTPEPPIPIGPSYQVAGAAAIRAATGLPVAAVGRITAAEQADDIIRSSRADLVLLAKALLRDPYWPLRAAQTLGQTRRLRIPVQYVLAHRESAPFSLDPIDAPNSRAAEPEEDGVEALTAGASG